MPALRDAIAEAKLVARPVIMPAVAVGGFWLGAYQLSLAPWHHLTFIWVGGLAAALYGAYQTYRAISDRVLLARWLDEADEKAAAGLDAAAEWAKRLPSRHRKGFYARRSRLRRAGLAARP